MLWRVYKRHSVALLTLVALSLPFLVVEAGSLPANNDIETWIPRGSQVRLVYENFKKKFGVEEVILIAVDQTKVSANLQESLCGRLDRLPGVRRCLSPARMQGMMEEMGVDAEQFQRRVKGLSISEDGRWHGLILLLSDAGLKNRAETVRDIERELSYCQLGHQEISLSGAPVIVTELDRLGGTNESQKFFLITLLLCLGLLYYWLRDWRLSLSIMGLTIWAINLTMTIFKYLGGEMNFILGALSVMVTVFTIEAAIHVLHYHNASLGEEDPLGTAWRRSIKPCGMSMLTTAIGLFSVSVSEIIPVTQFGSAAALGAVISMATGLFLTPAILVVTKHQQDVVEESPGNLQLARLAVWLLGHHRVVIVTASILTVIGLAGLVRIESKIDPLDFLPKDSLVVKDLRRVEKELTNIDSVEAVVEFQQKDVPFLQRLDQVRGIEAQIRQHPNVRHTLSLASFFPEQMPDQPLELMQLLKRAESKKGQNEYVTADLSHWRISARIAATPEKSAAAVMADLEQLTKGQPVHFTGIAPLLQQAQLEIFTGFWQSFVSALGVILLVMVVTLRSVKMALLAIIPNLVPICLVYGVLGWIGFPVDIGMMMTGSIALGITVDGTFHFLTRYEEALAEGKNTYHSTRIALLATGGPIFESIVVSSIGMLALTLSSFAPTVRFGLMMAILLTTALAGGLVLLPAMLCWLGKAPHMRMVRATADVAPANHLHRRRARVRTGKVA